MGNNDIKFTAKLEAIDGKELVFPPGHGVITHVCCDCGATHLIEVIPHKLDRGFTLRFLKDNRSTGPGPWRRWLRKKDRDNHRKLMKEGANQFIGHEYPVI